MERTSKKHIYFLALTLLGILLLSVSIHLLTNLSNWGGSGSTRSGTFVNTSQGIDRDGWYFNADEATGNSTFIANLSQNDLDSFKLESRIASGEMALIMVQGSTLLSFDLSESDVTVMEIDTDMLEPGRVEMRLYFTNVLNAEVTADWRSD